MSDRPDERDVAWDNILSQHQNRVTAEAFVRAIMAPMEVLVRAASDLFDALDYQKATGARLDLIGSIVGVSRDIPSAVVLPFFGFEGQPATTGFNQARMRRLSDAFAVSYHMPDLEYRSMIGVKIALNNGHGTSPEIRDALIAAMGTQKISVRDAGNAHAAAWIGRIPRPEEVLPNVIKSLLPRMGGVKLDFVFYDAGKLFGFAEQRGTSGFGVGVMVRSARLPILPN